MVGSILYTMGMFRTLYKCPYGKGTLHSVDGMEKRKNMITRYKRKPKKQSIRRLVDESLVA